MDGKISKFLLKKEKSGSESFWLCATGKGHEITKISELLRMLELKNSIVTIDVIGCQKEIIRIIREEKTADYVIALKKNQANLHDEVVSLCYFRFSLYGGINCESGANPLERRKFLTLAPGYDV